MWLGFLPKVTIILVLKEKALQNTVMFLLAPDV
jgi:hypothetical protein